MDLTFKEKLMAFLDPTFLVVIALYYFVRTSLRIIFLERSPLSVFNIKRLRGRAFSDFWEALTPSAQNFKAGEDLPPLEGSLALLTPHLAEISGTVLELGPGNGYLTHYYPADQITAIYGAEPNENLHGAIHKHIAASGLNEKYHILSCGAETKSLVPALEKAGLLASGTGINGIFDTIISVRVLCGVSDLKDSLKTLHLLLKPGGRLILIEHVINPWSTDRSRGSFLGRLLQVLYKPVWEFLIHCRLDTDTERILREVWKGDMVELKGRLQFGPLPWIGGVLVKKE